MKSGLALRALVVFIGAGAGVAGCGSDGFGGGTCDPQAVERVASECALTFSGATNSCAGQSPQERRNLNVRLCGVSRSTSMTAQEAQCLLTTSCEDLLGGACASDRGPPAIDPECFNDCVQDANACSLACADDFDCEDCVLRCAAADRNCRQFCPRVP